MAALQPVLVVTDVPVNSGGAPVVTSVPGVISASITWSLGKAETVSYKATGAATSHLTPGAAPSGTRIIGISLGNGDHQDTRMLSGGAEVVYDEPPYVSESGTDNGLGSVLAHARIGRTSFQQVRFDDVLTAAAGQIRQQAFPTGTLRPNPLLPSVAGVGTLPIGPAGTTQATALAFTYVVDPSIAGLVLDLDINRDTRLRSLENVTEHLGSASDPDRAQFVIDSGDYGVVEGSMRAQTVTIGHKGTVARFTFDGLSAGNVPQMVLRQSQAQAKTVDQCYSCAFSGGDTHHGMPASGSLTCIKTTNRSWADGVTAYRLGMPILGVYTDRDHGGVYAWIGDGALHPISQAMGVRDLWYDETLDAPYAATDAGVYTQAAGVWHAGNKPWSRIGAMALKVTKLCKDAGILYGLAAFSDGSTHILQYPAAAGATTGHGYDGWSIVHTRAGIVDFGILAGVLYCITSTAGSQAAVYSANLTGVGTRTAAPIPFQVIAGDTVATGLDVITTGDAGSTVIGIFVRTSAGSAGLYYIINQLLSNTTVLFNADPAGTLVTDPALSGGQGRPVMVNKITAHPMGPAGVGGVPSVAWDDGASVPVDVWAATDSGIYASVLVIGGFSWRRTNGQSNLGDIAVEVVASAPPRRTLGQLQTRVYAIAGRTLYESDDGTLHFVDMMSQPLDAGPAWYELVKRRDGVYPTTATTTLLYPNPTTGPYSIIRQLNGLGQFEYIGANPASTAPSWAHRDTEITQISASALVPEIPLSQLLIDAMVRFLAFTSAPLILVEVESAFDDTADLLRTLRPTQLVNLTATLSMCGLQAGDPDIVFTTWTAQPMYVLSHTITVDAQEAGIARTRTQLGSLLIDDRSDPLRVSADLWYNSSRQQLYRSKGHR